MMEVAAASILCLVVFIFIIIAVNINSSSSKSDFSIEYYPITDRYYPKYGDYYLGINSSTGIVEKKEDYLFCYAHYGSTEEEAKRLIEKFKEQQLKVNVKKIKL